MPLWQYSRRYPPNRLHCLFVGLQFSILIRSLRLHILSVHCFDIFFFFSSRRRHTRSLCDWSSDVCSSDLATHPHVKANQGEMYRLGLENRAKKLGVDSAIIFHNRFVSQEELTEFLSAAEDRKSVV